MFQKGHGGGILIVLRIVRGRGVSQRPNQLSKREKEAAGNLDDYGYKPDPGTVAGRWSPGRACPGDHPNSTTKANKQSRPESRDLGDHRIARARNRSRIKSLARIGDLQNEIVANSRELD